MLDIRSKQRRQLRLFACPSHFSSFWLACVQAIRTLENHVLPEPEALREAKFVAFSALPHVMQSGQK